MKTERSGVSVEANARNSGRYAATKTLPSTIPTQGSFKRQIILAFVVGFFLLAGAFTAYQVKTESTYLYQGSTDETISLAESLAASSRSWVLAYDLNGMQEVVHSFKSHPELRYAMLISPAGRVLAHSDPAKVGQFLSDEASLTLIKSQPVRRIMIDDESLSDIAVPIMMDHRHIGWARIAQGREGIADNLRKMMLNSVLFVLAAVILSLFAALLIANRLGYRIGYLVRVAEKVQAGDYASRVNISGEDEIAKLANSLNHMLDVLARDEEQLRVVSLYTRSLIEASLDPLVTISPEGKITDVNQATENVTGRSRAELIRTDFSDYFTQPDKAREGYRKAFLEGFVTDYPLALRHSDGHVTDVLYNASVYRNEAGEVLGVFAAARDITEHKRAEATRTQLAAIVESSNDAIIGKSLDGIIISWNKSAERIYGYPTDEIIGKHVTTLAPLSRHAEVRELLEKVGAGGTVENHESERIRKDGVPIFVALTLSPIRDGAGNIIGISTIARDITERKQAENALKEKEERLALATVNNGVGIWDWNLQTQQMIWDDSMYVLYHIRREDFIGTEEAWRASLHPDDLSRGDKEVEDAIAGRKPFETEFRVVWPNGEIRHIKAVAKVFRDEQGTPLRMLGINMDVTERRKAEMELRRSERGLSEAQRIAHLGNWELDLTSNALIWSDEIFRIFEIDPGKFGASYEAFLNAIHPDDRELVNNAYTESVKHKKPYDIVHRLLMKDGRVKYVNEKCETHYGEDGKPLRSVGTVHDITERKRVEDALFFVSQRGWQISGENFFDALAQFLGEKLDMDYVLIDRIEENPEMAETVALYAKGAITPNMRYALKGTPCENVMGRRLCVYPHGIQQLFPEDTLLPGMGAESYIGIPLWDSTGKPIGLIAVMGNKPLSDDAPVTQLLQLVATRAAAELERKRAEAEIRKLNQELEQRVVERTSELEAANKELEAFAYSVSHDLRAPLRAIDGFSAMLQEDYAGKLDDEGKRLLNVVHDNTIRMGQLIDDILKFSRTGRLEINFSEIDMESLAHSVVEEIQPANGKLQVEIEAIPSAIGDHAMLRQVFVNLLSNAIKFSSTREIPRIKLGGFIEGKEAVYYVRDNGVGFDMQYADKLFGVFQRLHGMNEFEGTGIGLAIVKRIVTRHGGRVWAEGKVNEGATIYFSIPSPAKRVMEGDE